MNHLLSLSNEQVHLLLIPPLLHPPVLIVNQSYLTVSPESGFSSPPTHQVLRDHQEDPIPVNMLVLCMEHLPSLLSQATPSSLFRISPGALPLGSQG